VLHPPALLQSVYAGRAIMAAAPEFPCPTSSAISIEMAQDGVLNSEDIIITPKKLGFHAWCW
jgi:hypothetical protein